MKFTLSWLKDHLDTTASLDQIAEALTGIGLEVEAIDNPASKLQGFVVAEIREAVQHPEADRLRVCRVNNGAEELQVVCGAPNARAGIKVVLATVGAVVPANGMKIVKSKIRGVESNGMLCSETELLIGEGDNGIVELPANLEVGQPIAVQLGLDDPVIEVAITPDRADCLGVRGIARDLAAAGLGQLKPLKAPAIPAANDAGKVSVTIANDGNSCRQFLGRSILGVTNAQSPEWLQHRLKSIGLRPISALVDITNYFSYDLGRPLHVYDIAKLKGTIQARLAREGESFLALNNKEYTATAQDSVIADDSGVLGFGGIIGGYSSSCDEGTKDVFLECAYFDAVKIAETGRRHEVLSDARYRFERGVDPDFLAEGVELATRMILDLCGGTAQAVVQSGQNAYQPFEIRFRPERVQSLGGMDVQAEKSQRILEMLGFKVTVGSPFWTVKVPSWRGDVSMEADLVEEVMRIVGLDKLPATPLPRADKLPDIRLPLSQVQSGLLRRSLAMRGAHDVHCYSFTQQDWAVAFGGGAEALKLLNPINSELDAMRPSLLPNLLSAVKRNLDRGQEQIVLAETGLVFHGLGQEGQSLNAATVRAGLAVLEGPHDKKRPFDAFDAKGDAQAALEALGAPVANLRIDPEGAPAWYHPGRSGAFKLGPKQTLAVFGELHPAILKQFGFKQRVVACEIYPAAIPAAKAKGKARAKYTVSDLQMVKRDFAFLLAAGEPVEGLVRPLQAADKQHVVAVDILSDYQDEKLKADGQRSVALRVSMQPQTATFTDVEIDAIAGSLLTAALKVKGVRPSEGLLAYVREKNLHDVLKLIGG